MGERYQTHLLITKDEPMYYSGKTGETNEFRISVHMQWCWGAHIIRNMHRLLNTLNRSNMKYLTKEEIEEYVKAIIVLNKGFDGGFYHYNIHMEEPYQTFNGDSNHGWNVIKVHIDEKGKTKITSRFYNYDGEPVSNEQLIKNAIEDIQRRPETKKNLKEVEKVKKICNDKLFNNTQDDLQAIFNKGIK